MSDNWSQIGSDILGGGITFRAKGSVSLSSDGNVVAFGTPDGIRNGHVKIFKNESGSWTQIGSDIISDEEADQFGWAVSLSSDGLVVAIGAIYNDGNGKESGRKGELDVLYC